MVKYQKRTAEIEAAVQWCRENKASGYLALKSGLFPSIKHRNTIDRRLNGEIVTGKEKEYCSILTKEDESLCCFIKNKNLDATKECPSNN